MNATEYLRFRDDVQRSLMRGEVNAPLGSSRHPFGDANRQSRFTDCPYDEQMLAELNAE